MIFCASIDLSNTSPFPFKNIHSTLSQLPIHVAKSTCGLMYRRLVPQISPSERPLLHPSPSFIGLTIIDALRLTKSRKISKSDLASIDFDYIDVRDVKYLPSYFNDNVLFLLPPVALRVPSTHDHSMDGMDKMCDCHHWCTTKTTTIQNDFGLFFQQSTTTRRTRKNDYGHVTGYD